MTDREIISNRINPHPSRGYDLGGTSCTRGLHGSAAKPAKKIEGAEPHPIPLRTIWERGLQRPSTDPKVYFCPGFGVTPRFSGVPAAAAIDAGE
jgi:hypothetical protein